VDDDEDEQLDAVVDALNELRQWREGTSVKARALGLALAGAPGLSAAIAADLSAAASTTSTGSSAGSDTPTGVGLPHPLQRSFDAVLSETGRVLLLAEHQVAAKVHRPALSARQLGDGGFSSTLNRCHPPLAYSADIPLHTCQMLQLCCRFSPLHLE
jgi:hypothetical protein